MQLNTILKPLLLKCGILCDTGACLSHRGTHCVGLRRGIRWLHEQPRYIVTPSRSLCQLFFVERQGEFAQCSFEDIIIGSYAATTCCIIATALKSTKFMALAHLDEATLDFSELTTKLLKPLLAQQEAGDG